MWVLNHDGLDRDKRLEKSILNKNIMMRKKYWDSSLKFCFKPLILLSRPWSLREHSLALDTSLGLLMSLDPSYSLLSFRDANWTLHIDSPDSLVDTLSELGGSYTLMLWKSKKKISVYFVKI